MDHHPPDSAPASASRERVHVLVRVKPSEESEIRAVSTDEQRSNTLTLHGRDHKNDLEYSFDRVFGEAATQDDVYKSVRDSIAIVIQGVSAVVMAYGQTGTGKTYTMMGCEQGLMTGEWQAQEKWGVIPRALQDLFDQLVLEQETSREQGTSTSFNVQCSYMQIYNDKIYDLLADRRRENPLAIRETVAEGGEDEYGSIYVQGLSTYRVASTQDVISFLRRGCQNRAMRATDYNSHSSRSHAVLQMSVEVQVASSSGSNSSQDQSAESTTLIRRAKLNLVDLAGSEKWGTAGHGKESEVAKELTRINTSLSALGNCIAALGETGRKHIPYRDSPLTRVLQDSLAGGSRTVVIGTVSAAIASQEETSSTLAFVMRCRRLVAPLRINEVLSDTVLLQRARQKLEVLRRELKVQKGRASSSEGDRGVELLLARFELREQELEQEVDMWKERALGQSMDCQPHGRPEEVLPPHPSDSQLRELTSTVEQLRADKLRVAEALSSMRKLLQEKDRENAKLRDQLMAQAGPSLPMGDEAPASSDGPESPTKVVLETEPEPACVPELRQQCSIVLPSASSSNVSLTGSDTARSSHSNATSSTAYMLSGTIEFAREGMGHTPVAAEEGSRNRGHQAEGSPKLTTEPETAPEPEAKYESDFEFETEAQLQLADESEPELDAGKKAKAEGETGVREEEVSPVAAPVMTPEPLSTASPRADGANLGRALVLYNYKEEAEGDLSLRKGDMVEVQERAEDGWWTGSCKGGPSGTFPSNFVKLVDPGDEGAPAESLRESANRGRNEMGSRRSRDGSSGTCRATRTSYSHEAEALRPIPTGHKEVSLSKKRQRSSRGKRSSLTIAADSADLRLGSDVHPLEKSQSGHETLHSLAFPLTRTHPFEPRDQVRAPLTIATSKPGEEGRPCARHHLTKCLLCSRASAAAPPLHSPQTFTQGALPYTLPAGNLTQAMRSPGFGLGEDEPCARHGLVDCFLCGSAQRLMASPALSLSQRSEDLEFPWPNQASTIPNPCNSAASSTSPPQWVPLPAKGVHYIDGEDSARGINRTSAAIQLEDSASGINGNGTASKGAASHRNGLGKGRGGSGGRGRSQGAVHVPHKVAASRGPRGVNPSKKRGGRGVIGVRAFR